MLVQAYVAIVAVIKRYHDRNKSGYWYFLVLIPIVGAIWIFIEAGFLRGTIGRNDFGPDPLAGVDDIATVFDAPERLRMARKAGLPLHAIRPTVSLIKSSNNMRSYMTWSQFLFSPTGRINRARYWGALAIQYGIIIASWTPVAVLSDRNFGDDYPIISFIYVGTIIVVTIALIVSHIFSQIKRLHDRDKSWPWIFIQFIPYIGGVWIVVELGILSGTKGHNRFGTDPLGRIGDIVDVFDGPRLGPGLDSSRLDAPPTLGETAFRPAPTKI